MTIRRTKEPPNTTLKSTQDDFYSSENPFDHLCFIVRTLPLHVTELLPRNGTGHYEYRDKTTLTRIQNL